MSLNFNEIINPIPGLASGTAKPGRFIYVNVGNKIVKCRAGNEILTKKVTVVRNESGEYIAFSEVGNRTLSTRTTEFFKSRNTTAITAIGFPIKILFSILKNGIYYFYIGGDRPEPELVYELDSKSNQVTLRSAYLANTGNGLSDWSLFLKWEDRTIKDTAIWDDGSLKQENTIFVLHKSPNHEILNNHVSYKFIEPKGFGYAVTDLNYWLFRLEINFYATSNNDNYAVLFSDTTQGTDNGSYSFYLPIELYQNPVLPYVPVLDDLEFIPSDSEDHTLNYTLNALNPFCNDNSTLATIASPSLSSFRWDKETYDYDWGNEDSPVFQPEYGRIWFDNSYIESVKSFPSTSIFKTKYDLQNYKMVGVYNFQTGGGNFYNVSNNSSILALFSTVNFIQNSLNVAVVFNDEDNYQPFYTVTSEGMLTENKIYIEGAEVGFRNRVFKTALFDLVSYSNETQFDFKHEVLNGTYSLNDTDWSIDVTRKTSRNNKQSTDINNQVTWLSSDLNRFNNTKCNYLALTSESSFIRLFQDTDSFVQFINNTLTTKIIDNTAKYYLHNNDDLILINWSNFPYTNNRPVDNEFIELGGLIPDLLINYTTLLNNSIYRLDFDTDLMIDDKNIAIETYTINNDGTITNGITQASALSLKVGEDDIPYFAWWSSSYYN